MSTTWQDSRRYTRKTGSAGFTLIETLVALLLLVIVSAALYTSYFTVMRARDAALAGTEERRELRGTIDLLRREITATIFKRGNKQLQFVVEDRDIFGKPASTLTLTTVTPPRLDSRPASDLIEVRYKVTEKDGALRLSREARDPFLSTKAVPYAQIEELEGFLVECHDGGKWVKSWDTALNPTLPGNVRVTLRVRDRGTPVEFTLYAAPRVRN